MWLRDLLFVRFDRCMRIAFALGVWWVAAAATMWAAGPRWITGPPYFTTAGAPVVWYTNQPLYFTDPGDLSSSVNHAAADAIVAAAASVWNVPTASLVLTQGGALSEHVSGANTFLGPSGLIFPADVQSSNYAAKQIAVIYDDDGSVTDLLLGNGASDPTNCLQNGVTESVDSIVPAGLIQHAILVLNGRCTGPDSEQQMQLQYQLMRAFGRVLGLGWSQTNDNVFTGSPQATFNQAMHWPVMHPIDIICGPYTYQCMPQPFTLRPDDLSALGMLYYMAQGTAPPGKTDTLLNASQMYGQLLFPTGQGMQGVNVVGRRWEQFTPISEAEDWYTTSTVSGFIFRQTNGNPVAGVDDSMTGSEGTQDEQYEGFYDFARVPMLPGSWQVIIVETEPINPLYTGQYAVGPYTANTVEPSGTDPSLPEGLFSSYVQADINIATIDPASSCNTASDGTEAAPAAVASQGWWSGLFCGYGHSAWSTFSVKGNRSVTLEVTAEDEQEFATAAKAMPVIGIWNATDPLGSLPGVAGASEAFNGAATGMTTLTAGFTQPDQLRIAIADQRGDGRPDFNYQARVLYADSVSPAAVSAAGGTVTIMGTGFRTGNAVFVNGVAATVLSWTASAIVATVPSLHTLGVSSALVSDITVEDLSTGGMTVMTQALSYAAPTTTLSLLTAPSGTQIVEQPIAIPFAVQVLKADGITPVVGEAVAFATTAGSVEFATCGTASCTVQTDAHGIASTIVTPQTAGAVIVQAMGVDGTATASFTAIVQVRSATAVQAVEYVAAGASVMWTPQVSVADNTASAAGVLVNWQTVSGPLVASPGQSQVNAEGVAQTLVTAGPLASGAQAVVSACAWTNVCATFTTQGVDPADFRVTAISGAGQVIPASGSYTPVVLQITDVSSHPVAGAIVQLYQTVDAWQPACPDRGRCPIPPVLASSQISTVSDVSGLVTLEPQQLPGTPGTTNLAAAAGTQGFLSLSFEVQP
jgi:IPT/TIG domain